VPAVLPAEIIPTEPALDHASEGSPTIPDSSTAPSRGPSVAIIGAGVIGLAIGWRLAQQGARVDIFERDAAGQGASWAAAGMLAAGIEAEPGEDTLYALNRRSQAMWPGFAAELEAAAEMPVGYRAEGTLEVALTRDDLARLRFHYEHRRSLGIALEWLSGAEARRREPHLHPGVAAAVLSAGDHQVDNREVATALRRAVLVAGGALHEHQSVDAVEMTGGRVSALRLGERRHRADVVVLAAGAWSPGIAGLPEIARPPVRPIKGQMLALRMDPATPLVRHVLWTPRVYLVPRGDGRLIVGGTVEERGFDTALTAGGIFALLEGAWRAVPGIEDLPIAEMWVGFRPGSRDDAPIVGPSGVEGLVIATGHHRNGILLAPVTAEAVAGYILRGEVDEAIRPFGIGRFAAKVREGA
jgi:glycine oxidase